MYVSTVIFLLCACFMKTSEAGRYTGRDRVPKGPGGNGGSPGGVISDGNGGSPGGVIPGGNGGSPGGMTPDNTGGPVGPVPIPGGIGECLAIVPFHRQLADFALQEMGTGYILREILGVRTSIVAGTMYHMELYVATSSIVVTKCLHCDVKVVHQPWMPKQLVLHRYQCKDTCCRGNGAPTPDNKSY